MQNIVSLWNSAAAMQRTNYWYILIFFTLLAAGGSGLSFLLVGAMIWAAISVGLFRFTIPASRSFRSVALIFALYYFSAAVGVILHWGDRGSLFELINRLPFLVFLPLAGRISLSSPSDILDAMEKGALAGAVFAAAAAEVQILQDMARPVGFAANANVFALGSMVTYAVCLLAAWRRTGKAQMIYLGGCLLAGFAVYAAGSRMMWAMLVILPVLVSLLSGLAEDRLRMLGRAGAVLLLAGAAFAIVGGDRFIARLTQTADEVTEAGTNNGGSLDSRVAIWTCSLQIIAEHPLAGRGISGALQEMGECTKRDTGTALFYSHFHNFVLDSMAKGGVTELFARLAILLALPLLAFRRLRHGGGSNRESREYGTALAILSAVSFGASGLTGIFIGHDVHDSIFIFMSICAAVLAFQPDKLDDDKIVSAPYQRK